MHFLSRKSLAFWRYRNLFNYNMFLNFTLDRLYRNEFEILSRNEFYFQFLISKIIIIAFVYNLKCKFIFYHFHPKKSQHDWCFRIILNPQFGQKWFLSKHLSTKNGTIQPGAQKRHQQQQQQTPDHKYVVSPASLAITVVTIVWQHGQLICTGY